MCTRPIAIKNVAAPRRNGAFPYIQVPCRHCDECQLQSSNDYFLRSWSIYRALDPNKWTPFFVTLTFNDDNLPYHHFYRRVGEGFEHLGIYPTFDHDLLHKCLKSFRQYFRRLLSVYETYVNPKTNRKCKRIVRVPSWKELPHCLVTCELGEKTHRPHYHMICFVPFKLSYKQFQNILHRFWTYGFTKSIKIKSTGTQQGDRSDANCFRYVTKYVAKGFGNYIPEYVSPDWFTDIPRCRYMPRVFTTNGYGSWLLDLLSEQNIKDGSLSLNVEGKYQKYSVPQYALRKILYKSHFIDDPRIVLERKDGNFFEEPYYDVKRKTFTQTERTELGDKLSLEHAKYSVSIDYFHARQAYFSAGNDFQNYLDRIGFPYHDTDVKKSLSEYCQSDYTDYVIANQYYFNPTNFIVCSRDGYMDLLDYCHSLPFMPDIETFREWHRQWIYLERGSLRVECTHLEYIIRSRPCLVISALIRSYKDWQCELRELAAIGRRRREKNFYLLNGVQKNT